MSEYATDDADGTDRQYANQALEGRARDLASRFAGGNRRGTLAMLAGGALFARAFRASGRGKTAVQGLAGLALVGYGLRQRLSGDGSGGGGGGGGPHDRPDDRTGATDEDGGPTEAMRHESHTGTNPRDVEQEPDVETETEPDEGRVQFTSEQSTEPDADTAVTDEGDPRMADDDETVEVDISESHMADEPNEAAGPSSEQAFPTQVEDTEPDPTPEADASHVEADVPDAEADETDEEGSQAGDGQEDAEESGEDVSTEDSYEGERGEDGTVDDESGSDDSPDNE